MATVKIEITSNDVANAYNDLVNQMNEDGNHQYSKSLYSDDVLALRLESEINVGKENEVDEAAVSKLAAQKDVKITRNEEGKVTSIVRVVPYTVKEIEQMKKDLQDRKEDMEYQKQAAQRRAERDGTEFDESMFEIDETIPSEREEWISIPTQESFSASTTQGLHLSYSLDGEAIGFDSFGGIDIDAAEFESFPTLEEYKAAFGEYLKSEKLATAFETIKRITGTEFKIVYNG